MYGHYIDGGVLPCSRRVRRKSWYHTRRRRNRSVLLHDHILRTIHNWMFGLGRWCHPVEECRALYDTCSDPPVPVTTLAGMDMKLRCPCFDRNGSNTDLNDRIPGYLSPDEIAELPCAMLGWFCSNY